MNVHKIRCWFCRMPDPYRWLGIPVCGICRDQLYDFFWVSLVQTIVWLLGGISACCFLYSFLSSTGCRRPGIVSRNRVHGTLVSNRTSGIVLLLRKV